MPITTNKKIFNVNEDAALIVEIQKLPQALFKTKAFKKEDNNKIIFCAENECAILPYASEFLSKITPVKSIGVKRMRQCIGLLFWNDKKQGIIHVTDETAQNYTEFLHSFKGEKNIKLSIIGGINLNGGDNILLLKKIVKGLLAASLEMNLNIEMISQRYGSHNKIEIDNDFKDQLIFFFYEKLSSLYQYYHDQDYPTHIEGLSFENAASEKYSDNEKLNYFNRLFQRTELFIATYSELEGKNELNNLMIFFEKFLISQEGYDFVKNKNEFLSAIKSDPLLEEFIFNIEKNEMIIYKIINRRIDSKNLLPSMNILHGIEENQKIKKTEIGLNEVFNPEKNNFEIQYAFRSHFIEKCKKWAQEENFQKFLTIYKMFTKGTDINPQSMASIVFLMQDFTLVNKITSLFMEMNRSQKTISKESRFGILKYACEHLDLLLSSFVFMRFYPNYFKNTKVEVIKPLKEPRYPEFTIKLFKSNSDSLENSMFPKNEEIKSKDEMELSSKTLLVNTLENKEVEKEEDDDDDFNCGENLKYVMRKFCPFF